MKLTTLLLLFVLAAPMRLAAQTGQAAYNKNCRTCHGPQGQGNPAIAKALKVEIRDLSSKGIQDKSDEELRKTIVDGVGKMQAVKNMSLRDIKDAIAFVRSLAKK
jgi:mono/diheme cytochrome c family protein